MLQHGYRRRLLTAVMGGAICAIGGCATSPERDQHAATQSAAVPIQLGKWSTWEYPNHQGRTVINGEPGTLVLYQVSTNDTFDKVVKYYETISGMSGLDDPKSPSVWISDTTFEGEKIRAFQNAASFPHKPGERLPHDCFFFVRFPDYAVTASIRREPEDGPTRITLLFETR